MSAMRSFIDCNNPQVEDEKRKALGERVKENSTHVGGWDRAWFAQASPDAGILGIVMDFEVVDGGNGAGQGVGGDNTEARQLASRVVSSENGKLQRCSTTKGARKYRMLLKRVQRVRCVRYCWGLIDSGRLARGRCGTSRGIVMAKANNKRDSW